MVGCGRAQRRPTNDAWWVFADHDHEYVVPDMVPVNDTLLLPQKRKPLPMPQSALFDEVCQYVRQSSLLASVSAVLEWDERTMMPAAEAEHRADQTTLLSGMIHQRWTDEAFVAKVSELAAGPQPPIPWQQGRRAKRPSRSGG